jgi:hypothetical protein
MANDTRPVNFPVMPKSWLNKQTKRTLCKIHHNVCAPPKPTIEELKSKPKQMLVDMLLHVQANDVKAKDILIPIRKQLDGKSVIIARPNNYFEKEAARLRGQLHRSSECIRTILGVFYETVEKDDFISVVMDLIDPTINDEDLELDG